MESQVIFSLLFFIIFSLATVLLNLILFKLANRDTICLCRVLPLSVTPSITTPQIHVHCHLAVLLFCFIRALYLSSPSFPLSLSFRGLCPCPKLCKWLLLLLLVSPDRHVKTLAKKWRKSLPSQPSIAPSGVCTQFFFPFSSRVPQQSCCHHFPHWFVG